MALYVVYDIEPNGCYTELGKVRAKNSPQAVLKGYKKFGIFKNDDQLRIGARPVVKAVSKTFARQLLGGMRKLMGR